MIDPKTGLAIASTALDVIGAGRDDAAEAQRRIEALIAQRQALQAHWNDQLMALGQRASEQGDDRMKYAGHVANTQALLPLMDRGFSAITQRFAQGPAQFGQVGAQNAGMQASNSHYQPGRNPSINAYGNDLSAIRQRFMTRPVFDDDEERRRLAAAGPTAGWRNQR